MIERHPTVALGSGIARGMAEIQLHYLGRTWQTSVHAGPMPPTDRPPGAVSSIYSGSMTAMGTALIRAAHGRLDPNPLIEDSWGDRLVPQAVRAAYRDLAMAKWDARARPHAGVAPEQILDEYLGAARTYASVVLRARYTEDALQACIAGGVRQYVIIGAGFDSFALRAPPYADGVPVFEIDLPAVQNLKRQCILDCGIAVPQSLHFVAADLAREALDAALVRTGFRSDRPAFFSWLGVTMFLTREANLATLEAVVRSAAPGSELVFTYLEEAAFRAGSESFRGLQESVQASGEPLRSGFDPDRLAEELHALGLELIEDRSEEQILARLSRNGSHRMTPLPFSRIARARVIGHQEPPR